jgi:hypothetical protein
MLAVVFVALAGSVYGFDQVFQGAWSFLVVWGLIAGPVLMFIADREGRQAPRQRGRN